MNFKDFYKKGVLQYSFEVFPPKDEAGILSLFEALRDLSSYKPAFISVTYGALGSTRDLTRDLSLRIHRELNLTTAFHFTCVGTDQQTIKEYVTYLKKQGLHLVVALRGDPPQGSTTFVKPKNGFEYANELVGYLKEIDGFSMAVAGYPEGHIECPSKEQDLINLKRKVDAGAEIVLTQLFLDNKDFFDFVERARKIGIEAPIIPGILPVSNLKQIEKITKLCGAKIPEPLYKRLQDNSEDASALKNIGLEHAIHQCRELIKRGVPGIHFYTLNKSSIVSQIIKAL